MAVQQSSNAIDRLIKWLRPRVPFTVLNTVWRGLDKQGKSILDIGCGKGEPMRFINRKRRFVTVGADIFEPYLTACRREGLHDEYVRCDVRNLPFQRKSFDIVLCMEVLEHLERKDGERLIAALEEIARRQVVITTPLGRYVQHTFDNNPHQEHRTIWGSPELRKLGYRVRGHGFPRLGGEGGLASHLPKVLVFFTYVVYVLIGPFAYFNPQLGGGAACIKTLKE